MRLDMASVMTDLGELKKEVKKMQNKDQTIIKQNNKIERQHKQLFELIDNNKSQEQKQEYSYD
jgi:Sec-independent protein translocase protein TatA